LKKDVRYLYPMTAKQIHQLFDSQKIDAIIRRMAFQILESNLEEATLYLVGIESQGMVLADRIATQLKTMTASTIELIELNLDKSKPLGSVCTSKNIIQCTDKAVIVIDDVLNTGSTLIYAVDHFLQVPLKRLQTAVLVNRNHKRFPIKADVKGVSLSTSYKEHIEVVFGGNKEGVYLS